MGQTLEGKKAASEIRSRKAMEIHCLILRVSSEEGNFTKAKGKNVPCKRWGCSSAARAPALQAGGQEFDSPHLHHGHEGTGRRPSSESRGNGPIAQLARAHD